MSSWIWEDDNDKKKNSEINTSDTGAFPPLNKLKAQEIIKKAEAITEGVLLPLNERVLGPIGKGGGCKVSSIFAFCFLFR